MQISKEEIIHISNLASLNLSEKEIEKYVHDLQDILNYAEKIKSVDTSNIDEKMLLKEDYNIFREDKVERFEETALLLENAPSKENGMFKIPKII